MSQSFINVSVIGRFPLDQAGLEALLPRLPGFRIVPFEISYPPQVLVLDYGKDELGSLPKILPYTAILLLVEGDECPDLPPEASKGVLGLFSKDESVEALS